MKSDSIESKPLTRQQNKVLLALQDFQLKNGFSPSVRELGKILKIKSSNTIFSHLKALELKGYIEKGIRGQIKVLKTLLENAQFKIEENLMSYKIPLYGSIAAGFQAPAEDAAKDMITIDQYVIRNHQKTFALKVKGNSMELAGILPGDLILVEKTNEAKSGDIVVAHLPDGFTVKRYIIKNNESFLKAESSDNYTIKMLDGTQIWGVVVGSVRKY